MNRRSNVYVNQFNTATNRNLLPLAAGKIVSFARSDRRLSGLFDFRIEVLRIAPQKMVNSFKHPTVLGFSCYMWNITYSLEVARLAKLKFPNVLTVVGGPSTFRDEASITTFMEKHPYIDVMVSGEGELTFAELLHAVSNDADLFGIPGLSFQTSDGIKINPPRTRVKELDQLPSPFLDGTFDDLLLRHNDTFTGAVWETTRGCPFACSFCDWGQSTFSKVNEYSLERLRQELVWIGENRINYVFNADANFGIKKRDVTVAGMIANCKTEYGFPRVFSVSWVKNTTTKIVDIAEKLENAGIASQVTISAQSFDDKTLEAANRKNIPIDKLRALKLAFNRKQVNTYTEILLGLAEETYDSFSDGVVEAMSPYPTDHFVIYLLRMLENTEITTPEYIEKYGLKSRTCTNATPRRTYNDSTIPESEDIVIATSALPVQDWKRAYKFGYFCAAFYNFRIINILANYLRYVLGVSLKDYFQYLISEPDNEYTELFQITRKLGRCHDDILAGKKSVVQVSGFGETYWNPDEACYLIISKAPRKLYSDIERITLKFLSDQKIVYDQNELMEAIKFQFCMLPFFDIISSRKASFTRNWVDFYHHLGEMESNELRTQSVSVRFMPIPMTATTNKEFACDYIANSNSGSSAIYDLIIDDETQVGMKTADRPFKGLEFQGK